MLVIIPTYRRTHRQLTLSKIPEKWRDRTILVVDDVDARAFEDEDVPKLDIVPKKIKSIAQKRAWIIKRYAGEKILMLDDDLKFVRRDYRRIPTLIRQTNPDDVDTCLRWVEAKLEKFAHVGISVRQGNNNLEKTQRRRWQAAHYSEASQKELVRGIRWEPNYRMMYALGYDTDVLLKHCKLGRIEHREDMDYCLQLLRKGFENRVLTEFCIDAGQGYGAGSGGAAADRKIEESNADAEKLAKLHPGLVKVVDKEFRRVQSRKEVICFWKKAIQEGMVK